MKCHQNSFVCFYIDLSCMICCLILIAQCYIYDILYSNVWRDVDVIMQDLVFLDKIVNF